MAQIVYSGDQADRGQQQVVYTADGNSYTSVESAEHTLVYIHPADGSQVRRDTFVRVILVHTFKSLFKLSARAHNIIVHVSFQTVFADQPQVAYIQQDGTTQQVGSPAIAS